METPSHAATAPFACSMTIRLSSARCNCREVRKLSCNALLRDADGGGLGQQAGHAGLLRTERAAPGAQHADGADDLLATANRER